MQCELVLHGSELRDNVGVRLSVDHPEAVELAMALSSRTGESIGEAVVKALRERLERVPATGDVSSTAADLLAIGRECAALPDYDLRSADEILGYDEHGLPV